MPELTTGIDRNPDKQGGEPCIVETRIPVRRIGHLVDRNGYTPAETAEQYGISVSDVHRGLAYYYDHPEEMEHYDRRDRERERRADDATAETFEAACERLQRES